MNHGSFVLFTVAKYLRYPGNSIITWADFQNPGQMLLSI